MNETRDKVTSTHIKRPCEVLLASRLSEKQSRFDWRLQRLCEREASMQTPQDLNQQTKWYKWWTEPHTPLHTVCTHTGVCWATNTSRVCSRRAQTANSLTSRWDGQTVIASQDIFPGNKRRFRCVARREEKNTTRVEATSAWHFGQNPPKLAS